jgi:hypothetical protein
MKIKKTTGLLILQAVAIKHFTVEKIAIIGNFSTVNQQDAEF